MHGLLKQDTTEPAGGQALRPETDAVLFVLAFLLLGGVALPQNGDNHADLSPTIYFRGVRHQNRLPGEFDGLKLGDLCRQA